MNSTKLLVLLVGLALPVSAINCANVDQTSNSYQYVKLFGGDFPLPLRFELISWNDKSLEYSSPAPLEKSSGGKFLLGIPKYGFITIGYRRDLDKETGQKPVVLPITTCGPLEISRITPKEMREDLRKRFPPIFRIADEKHYLSITDVDENLWRELVFEFAENLNIPASNCRI